jgi:hypothetical protein
MTIALVPAEEFLPDFKNTMNINLNNFIMKNFLIFLAIAALLLTESCKSTFNASETLQNDENRNELYQNVISDPIKFSEFLEVASNNKDAQMLLMKNHMKMMEDGKMKEMIKENPEMKEKMEKKMQEIMENNPEMQKKMQEKMRKKMMDDPTEGEAMMVKMHRKMKANPGMMEKMMDKMIMMMHENPEMMEMMKKKMKEHQLKTEKQ